MFRRTISFFTSKVHAASTAKADVLEVLKTAHFINTFNPHTLTLEQQKQLLHAAIRRQEYDVAKMFLSRETIFSKDEYGDTPVVMALSDKAWDFLECAKGHVVSKSLETGPVFSIIFSEPETDEQEKMLGCAKDFFEIER